MAQKTAPPLSRSVPKSKERHEAMGTTDKINYNRIAEIAEDIVRSIVKEHGSIIGAYSPGSFSRGDMVYGSDVDIAFIAPGYPASNRVPPEITRIIREDILFEWGYVLKEVYDPKKLIENHPSPDDFLKVRIWYDPENFIENLQNEIRKEGEDKDFIKKRAINQLKIVENNFDQFNNNLLNNKFKDLLTNMFYIARHSFNIPAVILNRPVTHCRSYLYCRKNAI